MRLQIADLILWTLLPVLNFFLFIYVGTITSPTISTCDSDRTSDGIVKRSNDAMEELLLESLQELEEEQECEQQRTNMCSPSVKDATSGVPILELRETFTFEEWRAERLASMDMDLLLDTYMRDSKTAVLKLGNGSCLSIDEHIIKGKPGSCFAVSYVGHTNKSFNIVRHDSNIDHYGMSISRPDPSQVDKFSVRYDLNKHNIGRLWPQGFFRKVPKENGRLRTKQKLGTFVEYFAEIEKEFDAKLLKHRIVPGDDLVVMVVNEGEIDLYLNFACSCRLHNISLNNMVIFAGSRYVKQR